MEGKTVRFSPLEAAEIVGVSHKTLYDYSFFLKKGAAAKFDFNLHQDEKMILLRKYIKAWEENKLNETDGFFDLEDNESFHSISEKRLKI